MKNHRNKMTRKDVKGLLCYAVVTICGLLVKDSIWLEDLRVELGKSVVNGICIVAIILISAVLLVILDAIDRIIEKSAIRRKILLLKEKPKRRISSRSGSI